MADDKENTGAILAGSLLQQGAIGVGKGRWSQQPRLQHLAEVADTSCFVHGDADVTVTAPNVETTNPHRVSAPLALFSPTNTTRMSVGGSNDVAETPEQLLASALGFADGSHSEGEDETALMLANASLFPTSMQEDFHSTGILLPDACKFDEAAQATLVDYDEDEDAGVDESVDGPGAAVEPMPDAVLILQQFRGATDIDFGAVEMGESATRTLQVSSK